MPHWEQVLDCPLVDKLTVPVCRSRLAFLHRQKCQQNNPAEVLQNNWGVFTSIMKMPPCLSSPVTHHTTTRKITPFLSTSSSYTKQCLEAVECRQDKLVIALTAISVYLQIYSVYLQQCTHLRLGYTFLNLRKSNRIQQL